MIKVLIVDDSPTLREYLKYILETDPEIQIIGMVENGKMAVDFVNKQKPDIITMDIDMPVMNGLEATRSIMSSIPVPIVIITCDRNARNEAITMEALASGALTVIEKPSGLANLDRVQGNYLVTTIKTYARVKVLTRKFKTSPPSTHKKTDLSSTEKLTIRKLTTKFDWVAIGVSTGGPEVLKTILGALPAGFPLPIFLVQHITPGFLESMVSWLDEKTNIKIKIAEDKETPLPGTVYFAPDHHHMEVINKKIHFRENYERNNICPSVDALFKSLLPTASTTLAILLTGMGSDGAAALKELRGKGAITIAQDKKSSMVHGMPGEAIKTGGAAFVMNPDQIINSLKNINT